MPDFGSEDRLVPHDVPQQTSTMTAFFDNRRDTRSACGVRHHSQSHIPQLQPVSR